MSKLLNVLYTVLIFFPSGGGVDDVLVRLIKQIIKNVNLMCIAFSINILGIVNEFLQCVQSYFQYVYIYPHLTHNM